MSYIVRACAGALAVVAATAGNCVAQDAPLSLFGIAIGSQFTPSRDYLFVQNTTNTIDYTLRKVTNPEYLIQGVSVSQRSNVVVGINGRTASGDETACRRMLAESVEQLKQRYPKLTERVNDVNGRTLHTLSIKQNGCFTIVEVVKPALRVPCASSFLLRCERLSNAFVIEASDTEYSDIARNEARSIAHSPKRNHLD